jgi:histidyl-tRNA synthetase
VAVRPARLPTEPPRGMRDILPDEAELRDWMARTILDVYRAYGFRRIETPALEHIDLLTRGEGGENEKLIFKVLKRGEKLDLADVRSEADLVDLGLRFDLTVPLARYYAHNHAQLPKPLKAVQIGPVWRAERPQKGRFRQFTQCDIDILGVQSWFAEVELILATSKALTDLRLKDLTVRINDRRLLTAIARHCGFDDDHHDSVFITLDKWDKLKPSEIAAELTRAGQSASAIAEMIKVFTEFKAEGELPVKMISRTVRTDEGIHAWQDLKRIIEAVRSADGSIQFDATLVRGMSYYTGPIFEISSMRFPSSIAGGGRYDKLIGKILGQDVPATGFSIGFERVASILMDMSGGWRRPRKRVALLFDKDATELHHLLIVAEKLRREKHDVSLEAKGRKRGAQLAALEAQGFDGFADGPDGELQWFGTGR